MGSFEAFALHLSVYPTDESRPVIDTDGTLIGYSEYNFEPFGQSAKAMAIRVNAKGSVRIWYNQQWSRVSDYLDNLKSLDKWKEIPLHGPSSRDS